MSLEHLRQSHHTIDGYRFYLDQEQNELTIEYPHTDGPHCPVHSLTLADANALRTFLHLPDVAALLLAAEVARQQLRALLERE